MSGPKLVGITCDPVIIARNNERLKAVGKTIYFRDLFTNINTDISNEETWVNNYAASTLSRVPKDYDDPNGIIGEIKKVKMQHIEKAEKEKITLSVIRSMSIEELKKLGVKKIKSIPEWKDDFIREISILLKELQSDVEYRQSEIYKRKLASNQFSEKMATGGKKAERIINEMNKVIVTEIDTERYEVGEMLLAPETDLEEDAANLPYSFEELALLEMLENDMEEFEKCLYITNIEKEMIEDLKRKMDVVSEDKGDYPMRSKRSILYQIKLDYQRLNKAVSRLTADHNAEEQRRSTLIIEYTSFIKALDRIEGNYQNWSMDFLEKQVRELRWEVEKQEERIYVEESVEDVMRKYGYSGISSHNLHDAEKRSNIIFEDSLSKKISASFGDGMVMLSVVGEGNHDPTPVETKKQVEQQVEFCNLYPKIRDELEKKGIHIDTEDLEPVSEKHVMNIEIRQQEDIQKTTRRFSFRHVNLLSSDNDLELQYDTTASKVQYINAEGS